MLQLFFLLTFYHSFIHLTIGFVQFAAMSCSNMMVANIQGACRIGSLAMAAVKRFNSSTAQLPRLFFIFYGFVAVYSEHVQTCAYYLHRGKLQHGAHCADTFYYFILPCELTFLYKFRF